MYWDEVKKFFIKFQAEFQDAVEKLRSIVMNLLENERVDDLQYEGLKLIQNKNGFCFGVDSVLLADFAKEIKRNSVVVDIGTGTGIIGLLLCKKTNLQKIYGVEIQKDVADMAKRSVSLNQLEEKFEIVNADICQIFDVLEPHSMDCVVTNPPYKKANTGIQNEDETQTIARHEVKCTLEDVIQQASKLLKDKGEFYMVHRAERLVDIMCVLRKYRLEPKKVRFVHAKPNEKPNLILVKAVKFANPFLKISEPLVIYDENGNETEEIRQIYGRQIETAT